MNEAPAFIQEHQKMGSDYEMVQKVSSEFERQYQAQYPDIQRNYHNMRAYSGLDGGAWDDRDLEKLTMEDRTAYIFNVCRGKVDALTGSQMADKMETDWVPVERAHAPKIKLIKDLYDIDKDLWDYDMHFGLGVRDGNVMRGEVEMMIDRSLNGLPHIRFVHVDPAFVVRDNDWISNDEHDCESLFKVAFLSAQELKRIFNAKGSMIEQSIELQNRFGKNPETMTNPWTQVSREIKGDTYRVITHHWLDYRKISVLSGRKLGESLVRMSFPQNIKEDPETLERFMIEQKIDPFTLRELETNQKVNMSTSVCPSLVQDALLGNGKTEIQIGRLPLFHFTNARINGRDTGIVDLIYHINQLIQKDESKLSDLIVTAQGGGIAVNDDAFKRPEDRAKFEKEANDPSSVYFMDGDEMRKGRVFDRIPSNQYPSQIIDRTTRMYSVVDRLSTVDPAMEAKSTSEDSGVLYDRKLQVSRIGHTLQFNAQSTTRKRMGESYLKQARPTYSGARREFSSKDGKTSVTLNERVAKDNKIFIKNTPMLLPRAAVYVTESKQSLNQQVALRGVLFGLLEKASQISPENANILFREVMRTVTVNDPKTEARLEAYTQMQDVRDFTKIKADIATMDSQTQQAILQGMAAKMQTMQFLAQGGNPQGEEPENEIEQTQLQDQLAQGG